jgi:streptogramin lyase
VATKSTIWFVAGKSGRMIEIDPQRARFNSTALPAGLSGVRGAAAGVKNDVWLSFMKSRAIARFTRRNTWQIASLPWPDSRPQALVVREDGSVVIADAGRRKLVRYQPATNRFDEVGDLGPGGNIKAIVDLGDSIALADMGSDRLLIFPVSAPKAH